jgi:hypothetical protein
MAGKSNQGFFEPCWIVEVAADGTPDIAYRRPHEEVYEKLERYKTALETIAENTSDDIAAYLAEEALDA